MTDIIQMSKGGMKFYPQTHAQAIVGLNSVGTNLLINTSDDNDVDHPVKLPNADVPVNGSLSRTKDYTQVTAEMFYAEMFYRFCGVDSSMHNLTPGQTYTIQGEVYVSKGAVKFRSQYQFPTSGWADYDSGLSDILASNTSEFIKVKHTFTIPSNATAFYISWQVFNYDSTTIFRFRRMKLEKGSIATDYSLNPEDISTSESFQTELTKQIKANQPDLSGLQKASNVQTAISSALGKVDTSQTMSDSIRNKLQNMNKEVGA